MQLTITSIKEEVPGVRTFSLHPKDGSNLTYLPGQFLTFRMQTGAKERRRSYSLSSVPFLDAQPSITVKRVDNGLMSRWLIDRARVGDSLQAIDEATGLFTLPTDIASYQSVWLFAAGIGITPIYALLRQLLHKSPIERVVLLYSNRSVQHTVYYQELETLRQVYPDRFVLVHLWSINQDMLRARISKESFPLLRAAYLTGNPEQVLAYVCGPVRYMWLLQLLLQDADVPSANIRRELFELKKEVGHRLPADKEPHLVNLYMADKTYSFTNQYPQTILSSARAAGIVMPYSCDAGQCGSCTAICTLGKVWMSYNEVLTDRDLLAGRVLTCTGHAIEGDINLKL